MLIGAYGQFWERDYVDWSGTGGRAWRLLGRVNINRGSIAVTDFRFARGVYVLYGNTGIYYVGLASGKGGIGGRLKDHLDDDHRDSWRRFSWFSLDAPSDELDEDGVSFVSSSESVSESDSTIVIRDVEALLQLALAPTGNISATKLSRGAKEWLQVPTEDPELWTFESLKHKLV